MNEPSASNVLIKAFSEQELTTLLAELSKRDPWYHRYFLFALHTGMRRGEMLALTWHDIDLWKKREVIVPNPNQPRRRDENARRIAMDEVLLGLLLDLRSNSRWVFQKTNKRMLGSTVALFFRELSRDLNIPVSCERIRVTYAAHVFREVAPRTQEDWRKIQKRLGHKELSTTKNYFQRNREAQSSKVTEDHAGE